jgi:hypothetical protein
MKPQRVTKGLALPLLALAALAFCALAVSPEPREAFLPPLVEALSRRLGLAATVGAELLMALGAGLGLVLFLVILGLALLDKAAAKKGGRRRFERTRRQVWGLLLAVALLLALLALRPVQAGSAKTEAAGAVGTAQDFSGIDATIAEAQRLKTARAQVLDTRVLVAAAAGLGALLAGGLALILLLPRLKKETPPPLAQPPLPPPDEDREALASGLAATRARLEAGADPRAAVIACYGEMCDLFDPPARPLAPGAPLPRPGLLPPRRAAFLTAREFALLLRARGAAEPEIAALTEAFEKARYSRLELSEADREGARAALAALEARYAEAAPR